MYETSGIALALKTGVPCHQVEDEEGRIHLLLHLPIEEQNEDRWCLWRPDQARFAFTSIFDGALVEEWTSVQKNALKSDQSAFEKLPAILDPPRFDPPDRYMNVLQIPNAFQKPR
jgi:hypothetical protein